MDRETNLNEILNQLISNSNKIDYLKDLKEKSLKILKKDIDLDQALSSIAKEIKEHTQIFLNQKNEYGINYISGISNCIYLPDYSGNGEYKLKLIGGNRARTRGVKIDEDTVFDIDSITKLYTLILLFKLEELKLINLDSKLSELNPSFKELRNFSLNDLIYFQGEFITDGNITNASSLEEAYEILKNIYSVPNKKLKNKYQDFAAIVIGDTIEKVISLKLGEKFTLEEIMYKYLLTPLGLYNTQYNPINSNVSGNGNHKKLVYDSKSRILGGMTGNAGIFTNSDELAKISKLLLRCNYFKHGLLNKTNLYKLIDVSFESTQFFTYQSATGSYIMNDINNLIHNNILVNAVYEDDDKEKVMLGKPVGFIPSFEEYKFEITKNIMLMYVIKKYYNKYYKVKEDINVTKYI